MEEPPENYSEKPLNGNEKGEPENSPMPPSQVEARMSEQVNSNSAQHIPKFLSEKRVAEILDLKPQTQAKMLLVGQGPPFVKVGARSIRYSLSALNKYLNGRPFTNTTDARSIIT